MSARCLQGDYMYQDDICEIVSLSDHAFNSYNQKSKCSIYVYHWMRFYVKILAASNMESDCTMRCTWVLSLHLYTFFLANMPGEILVFRQLRFSMEQHVGVSIIGPRWGSVNLSQFTHHPPISQITHHPPKSGYSYQGGRGGSLTTVV